MMLSRGLLFSSGRVDAGGGELAGGRPLVELKLVVVPLGVVGDVPRAGEYVPPIALTPDKGFAPRSKCGNTL